MTSLFIFCFRQPNSSNVTSYFKHDSNISIKYIFPIPISKGGVMPKKKAAQIIVEALENVVACISSMDYLKVIAMVRLLSLLQVNSPCMFCKLTFRNKWISYQFIVPAQSFANK